MTMIQGVPDLGPGLRLHLNENTGGCSQKVVDAVRAFDAGAGPREAWPPLAPVKRDGDDDARLRIRELAKQHLGDVVLE